MANIQPRDHRGLDRPIGTWRDRRETAELRREARFAELNEMLEAQRLATRITCGARLARDAAAELMFNHAEFAQMAGNSTAVALDLADLHKVLALGCNRILHGYLNGGR
jgi:hypothetical protein